VDDDDRPRKNRRRADEDDEVDEDRPRKSRRSDDEVDEDRPRKSRRSDDDDDDMDDDRPRKRRRDEDDDDDQPRKKRKKKRISAEDLRAIATYQKAIMMCILVFGGIFVAGLATHEKQNLDVVWGISWLINGLVACVCVILLATKAYDDTGTGIIFGLLTLLPCVGLLVLLVINSKATSILKNRGIHVGLLGARMSDLP